MHESVLYQETLEALAIKADGVYVDGTFGRGGHSQGILDQLGASGLLVAIDKDLDAIQFANEKFPGEQRFRICHGSFSQIRSFIESEGLLGKVDGVLLDLGVSSPQLDVAERGFSFLRDGPLDMRMNQSSGQSAAEWISQVSIEDLRYVLKVYGEEKFANLIAKKIVERREKKPFVTTLDLAGFIAEIIPAKAIEKGKHPATRSFQAIRIYINQELKDIELLLADIVDVLAVGGRLVVISFHSLEDRLVKRFIKEQERGPVLPRNIPIAAVKRDPHLVSVSKAVKASADEVEKNVRSRSAIMRVAEKVAA